MTRMSRCWLAAVLSACIGLSRADERPADKPAGGSPGPKVYHFDISGAAGRAAEPLPDAAVGRVTDLIVEPAAAAPTRVKPVARRAPAALGRTDRRVRPAIAQPASLAQPEGALPIAQPPKPPSEDSPLDRGVPGNLPPPSGYESSPPFEAFPAPALPSPGGFPACAHGYCPIYDDNPWEDYCFERWQRRHGHVNGHMHRMPIHCCERPTSCCHSWSEPCADGEAPLPPPELPGVISDHIVPGGMPPHGMGPRVIMPDDAGHIPNRPQELPSPAKRRPPRNEIPKPPHKPDA
jgi:hypothetical protein